MKILFISRAYGKTSGGMERLSYDLIRSATAESSLCAQSLIHKGSRKTAPLFALLIIPKALLTARNFDVVHLGDPMLSIVGWIVKKILHKKIAVTVHGLDISYPNVLYQAYLRIFFHSFDYYFPISTAVQGQLKNHSVKGKVSIINPGISNDYYDASIPRSGIFDVLSRHNSSTPPPTAIFLLTSGRLVKRKGHAWFISNILPQLPTNIHYIIAGQGPEFSNITEAIKLSKVHERVHLLGRVSDNDLKILYNATDAFVQPNIKIPSDIEGFGLVLLEATLCNKPVFASNLEGMTDAIIPGSNGTLLPAEDNNAWIKILTAFITNHTQPTKSRAFTLKKYSWQSYINKFVKTLRSED